MNCACKQEPFNPCAFHAGITNEVIDAFRLRQREEFEKNIKVVSQIRDTLVDLMVCGNFEDEGRVKLSVRKSLDVIDRLNTFVRGM